MSPKQHKLYIGTWIKVKQVLLLGMTPKEADAERHEIHIEALGKDKSSKDFSNAEFDKVLDAMRKRLIAVDHTQPARSETEPRKRAIYGILHLGFDVAAISGVCRRNFHGREDFETFTVEELTVLKLQLTQWKRQRRREAAQPF